MKNKIAIVVIAYNRPDSLIRLMNSLGKACYDGMEVPLIISIDRCKEGDPSRSQNERVEHLAHEIEWRQGPKEVVSHSENLGLRKHVLSQGRWLEQYDAIVVLEDDLQVSPSFWMYVNDSVNRYKEADDVAGISLYSFSINYHNNLPFVPRREEYDAYWMQCAMSWGQVWMRKQWQAFVSWYESHQQVPFDTRKLPSSICSWSEKSWLKYHTRYCIEQHKYFLHPFVSLTTNAADAGTNMKVSEDLYQVPLQRGNMRNYRLPEVGQGPRYDGFFEEEELYQALNLEESDVTLDLNETHTAEQYRRYLLTTRLLPYRVLKSWACAMRPLSENVLSGVAGRGIWLYDTTQRESCPAPLGHHSLLFRYNIRYGFFFVRDLGLGTIWREFVALVKKKL